MNSQKRTFTPSLLSLSPALSPKQYIPADAPRTEIHHHAAPDLQSFHIQDVIRDEAEIAELLDTCPLHPGDLPTSLLERFVAALRRFRVHEEASRDFRGVPYLDLEPIILVSTLCGYVSYTPMPEWTTATYTRLHDVFKASLATRKNIKTYFFLWQLYFVHLAARQGGLPAV